MADGGTEHADQPDESFIYLRLAGDRFDAPGMPANSIIEVQRLSELIYDVARGVWLEQNPGRSRVPSAFVAALDLRLVSIGEGSALPVLRLPRPTAEDEEFLPVFDTAREVILDTFASVSDDRRLPDYFPRAALPALRRVGKTLADSDSMTLGNPRRALPDAQEPRRVEVGVETVEILECIDAALAAQPGPAELEGVVTEFDGYRGRFELRDLHGVIHVCKLASFEREVSEAVKAALAPDGVTAPDVVVSGIGVRDIRDRLNDLWDVHDVRVIRTYREKALMQKLSVVKGLRHGWWGGSSEAPDRDAVRSLEAALPRLGLLDVALAIGANAEGSVVLEWTRGTTAYTAHLEPGGNLFLCSDNTDTDELDERQLDYSEARLVRFVESGRIDV
ncbi:hypothetical protein [Sanguibacter antarcticus]|uniref:Uncharacterized protein n=1 Tax=Sanguibacter antarcticus TaxID=372484 RepID=A0A2A9E4T5_9MICO|nr:hypothetical protein [Sanguibacter antarcticus]PFG33646.1 hypothetical protein ATL42_1529 [Sanguibacter antarcticus]